MFRFSLVVSVCLIVGITAKPYKPLDKLKYEAFQHTVMSIDDMGKMSWGMEVEPPQDMDKTDYDIDPRMRIWKSMKGSGQNKQSQEPEEDLDELYHPSMSDLLEAQIQILGALPSANVHEEPLEKEADMKSYQIPEEDKDDIDHPIFNEMALVNQRSSVQMEPLRHEVRAESEVKVHLQPEEDMDELYHKDFLQLIPSQHGKQADAPADVPSQRKYSEAEEDLDHLYHQ